MDKASIQAAFEKAGFSYLLKASDTIVLPSIRIHSNPVEDATLRNGTSKIGGLPDLPPGVSWPTWHGLPQSFVAQIRLEDVHPYDVNGQLPAQGMLWFFYDAKQETFGETNADKGAWRILFGTDLASLIRSSAPATLPSDSLFKASFLSFTSDLTIAAQPQLEIPGLAWTDADQQKYDVAISFSASDADEKTAPRHRLLGHPETLQDDMRAQCELVSQGLTDSGDPDLTKKALAWQLLLQVDSDERIGMRWASAGMLYYWLKRSDPASQSFEPNWLVLQSD
jgi:uncharacterized protein YwqG